jgi:hypothetical protein
LLTSHFPDSFLGEQIQVTRNIVIDLDSTTSTKFSRHLIVRNLIFQNNQVQYFLIQNFLNQILHSTFVEVGPTKRMFEK